MLVDDQVDCGGCSCMVVPSYSRDIPTKEPRSNDKKKSDRDM
jgi:hypothetical protein